MEMMNTLLTSTLATSSEASGGASIIGWMILIGIVAAIYNACTKQKEYDVDIRGRIKER